MMEARAALILCLCWFGFLHSEVADYFSCESSLRYIDVPCRRIARYVPAYRESNHIYVRPTVLALEVCSSLLYISDALATIVKLSIVTSIKMRHFLVRL